MQLPGGLYTRRRFGTTGNIPSRGKGRILRYDFSFNSAAGANHRTRPTPELPSSRSLTTRRMMGEYRIEKCTSDKGHSEPTSDDQNSPECGRV